MTLLPKSKFGRAAYLGAVSAALAVFGPTLAHLGYRLVTPTAERAAQKSRYENLANAEVSDRSLSDVQRAQILAERMRLYYWFHARGWPVDEDDEDRGIWHPWYELWIHWQY